MRSVCGQESTRGCVLTPEHVEEDQTGTGRPVLVDQKEEHKIDFRVPGLSHAVAEEGEHLRVQELVKKRSKIIFIEKFFMPTCSSITSTTHSAKHSKAMIRELGNVELFELCETMPEVQCFHCLLYWNQGMCTAFADNSWLTANPEESLITQDWMHSVSRTT